MPRVVPSQVVAFIDGIRNYQSGESVSMDQVGSATLLALLDLVEQIPDGLLTMDKDAYASFIRAKAQTKDTLTVWTANTTAGHTRRPFTYHSSHNPLAHIRDALAKCPDESPAPGTSELKFITDPDLRTNLRNDIGAINVALANGEWKAATVLAGSTVEALLLWALQQREKRTPTEFTTAIHAAPKLPSKPLEERSWNLAYYIEAARRLKIISQTTAAQADLAREFRNFIHPALVQRLAQKCDRATALSAVAGMEHVVRDLTP